MPDDAVKNNEISKKAINTFLKQINYRDRSSSLKPVFKVVSQIFLAAGQKHLLWLITLRRFWLDLGDEFLARHAYPQNFSVLQEVTITDVLIEVVSQNPSLSPQIATVLRKLENLTFTKKHLLRRLQKQLKRDLTELEKTILIENLPLSTKETLLHLMVYDGAFTQAIQLNMPLYLQRIQKLFPDIKIDRIECHVGDLKQKRQDQMWVGKLAADWETVTSGSFPIHCVPAFIHRTNYLESTLIVYIAENANQSSKEEVTLGQKLLTAIYKHYPELQLVIQKVGFLVRTGMVPEEVRATSMLVGESAVDPASSYERLRQVIEQNLAQQSGKNLIKKETPTAKQKAARHNPADYLQEMQTIIHRSKNRLQGVREEIKI